MSVPKQNKNDIYLNDSRLTRRNFLAAVGTSVAGLTMPRITEAAKKQNRPNILFIMVDDLGKNGLAATAPGILIRRI